MTRSAADAARIIEEAEKELKDVFTHLDRIEHVNTGKVLRAFQENRVAGMHMYPSTGYGLNDAGREKLEAVFAGIFGAEAALVRPHIASGTHALAVCLLGLLRRDDTLLSITGTPYDTLNKVIGSNGSPAGSMSEHGIAYKQVELRDGCIDTEAALDALTPDVRLVLIQRSRGYSWRPAISLEQMRAAARLMHDKRPDVTVMVDNCYGEFTQTTEPIELGCDICAGSLIKNPGGGLAPTGGYIAGSRRLVELCAARLYAPGIGGEYGSYAMGYRPFFQGLFTAPHVVNQALKTAALTAAVFGRLGYTVSPASSEERYDIIQAVQLKDARRAEAFIRSVQAASPVDSFVAPEAADMAGYEDQVIMAAGGFIEGATIELSADAPMREPYNVYMQGSLTYSHGRLALEHMLDSLPGD